MNRRVFNKLAALGALATVAEPLAMRAIEPTPPKEVLLEDGFLRVAFDTGSGALIGMQEKSTGWTIQRRPELGVSFRLHAPLAHRRDNFVLGHKQKALSVQQLSGNRVRLHWNNLESEHGGVLPLEFLATVSLDRGNLTFEGTLINHSEVCVETIDFPYIGDLTPPVRQEKLEARCIRYSNLEGSEVHPHFANEKGYWGVDFPTKTYDSANSLFCLIQAASQGLYVEMRDPSAPYLLQYTFEQRPGVISNLAPFSSAGAPAVGDVHLVPPQDEISGIPVHLEFRTCHFLFANPQTTKTLVPVVMRHYRGDWHGGIDVYKEWRSSWYKEPHVPQWARDVHSWQQLQINSSEEEFRIPYKELPRYADECVKYGVTAIQLVGWNLGGQDRGNPSQDTDPGLGSWQELRDAIAQIQAKGIKIILFGKFPWADMTTEWYKKELYKYAAIDPYGIVYEYGGDSYHTPTQLAGINNRVFAVMDFCSTAYRDIATREFHKILDLKPAGWLYDEVCFHGQVKYSFNKDHGYQAPGYIYSGDLPLAKDLRDAADKLDPDFLFAGEGPQDWLTQYYPCSYHRGNATAVQQYIAPHSPVLVAVNGFDDREQLNRIFVQRSIISYEPYNFKGRLSNFPLTMAYGQKIDALRSRYKEWLWHAEFRDTVGASVTCPESPTVPFLYSVMVTRSGKRAVIIVNEDADRSQTFQVEMPDPGKLLAATPEDPEAKPASRTLQVAARSAIALMEQ